MISDGEKFTTSRRFRLGIILIISSMLCSYAALALLGEASLANNSRLKSIGFWVYLLTWIPFFGGLALSGREGYTYAKKLIWKRLFWYKDTQTVDDKKEDS